jgi:LmbE family N-acetylglucosaminyl deacetylase
VLAVVAHPDDESFGLGAVLSAFIDTGANVAVLCLTKGEASTLHAVDGDLAEIRGRELADAAQALGIRTIRLLDYPDGGLADVDLAELSDHVVGLSRELDCQGLVVFDPSGITGHPDHIRATAAAVHAVQRLRIGVLAWTLPADVAAALKTEFAADFRGHPLSDVDIVLEVDRRRQRIAVECHPSQAVPGSALWQRLALLGDREYLRWLVRADPAG